MVLLLFGFLAGCNFRLGAKEFMTVFGLSLFRAVTSFSLVIAYQNIASGVASIIHFMYPLAVAVVMIVFLQRKEICRYIYCHTAFIDRSFITVVG